MQSRISSKVLIISTVVLIALAWPAFSQTASDNSPKETSGRDDVSQLKQQISEQQKEIEQLRAIVIQMKQKMDQSPVAAQSATQAQSAAAPKQDAIVTQSAAAPAQDPAVPMPNLGQVASTSPIVPKAVDKSSAGSDGKLIVSPITASAPVHAAAPASSPKGDEESSPLQFHIGSATLVPVAFMDFTSVFRNHNTNGSIGTNFGSIPYASTTAYAPNLSEFRLSSENSRIGFRVDADVKGAHVMGYMEADFHGNLATNVPTVTNSNTLRERVYWVDVNNGHFEVLGGQTWSLMTPGRVGISPLPADIFYSQDIDLNYQLGLFFGRIPELRFVFHPSKKAAFAIALDSPDQYGGGYGGSGTITLPAYLNSTSAYQGELDYGSGTTLAPPNLAPDIIAKLAIDPVKQFHFEIGGIERDFKLYNPGAAATSTAPAIPNGTFSAEGGGGFVNLNVEVVKGLRLLTNNYFNDGGGRYIYGEAPDLIARGDGSISLIHSASTVTGFELTEKNTQLYGYYGGLNIGRNTATDPFTGKLVGYGYTGSANSQNRTIQEITFGWNQTFWKNPKYGALIFMTQYSYLTRSPWYVASTAPRNANINMWFCNLRYTLPGSAPTMGKHAGY